MAVRAKHVGRRAIDSVGRIGAFGPSDCHCQHRQLAAHHAAVEPASAAIGDADREHSVDPPLHDGRHAEPPNRKLQNQHVAIREAIHLELQFGGEARSRGGMSLFHLPVVTAGIEPVVEIAPIADRVESDCVKVGEFHLMSCPCEDGGPMPCKTCGETGWLGMSQHAEEFHRPREA